MDVRDFGHCNSLRHLCLDAVGCYPFAVGSGKKRLDARRYGGRDALLQLLNYKPRCNVNAREPADAEPAARAQTHAPASKSASSCLVESNF